MSLHIMMLSSDDVTHPKVKIISYTCSIFVEEALQAFCSIIFMLFYMCRWLYLDLVPSVLTGTSGDKVYLSIDSCWQFSLHLSHVISKHFSSSMIVVHQVFYGCRLGLLTSFSSQFIAIFPGLSSPSLNTLSCFHYFTPDLLISCLFLTWWVHGIKYFLEWT